jgi:hypothetical protein
MTREERKAKFFALMQRFVQLGTMLDDTAELDNVRLIVREMEKVKALIDGMIEREEIISQQQEYVSGR